jgi:hypothetical protein
VVLIATPIDLRRVIQIHKPALRVRYELQEIGRPDLEQILSEFFVRLPAHAAACSRRGRVMSIAGGDAIG